jgi:hypothetical protein
MREGAEHGAITEDAERNTPERRAVEACAQELMEEDDARSAHAALTQERLANC